MSSSAVFIDRDGTLIVERNYIRDPADVELIPGAAQAIRAIRTAGYKAVVVSNQSGIARGLLTLDDYRRVEARIDELLRAEGAELDGVYFCPHLPEISGPCECRKPGLGMFRDAARNLDIELAHSFYVGDRVRDVEPAVATGGKGILVLTGYGKGEVSALPDGVETAADLSEAALRIVGKSGATP